MMASVPSTVSMMLNPNGQNMYGQSVPVDHAALLEDLPDDTPPLLRALVAGAADDNDQLHAALDPLLTGESPTLDAFLTAAAWESHAGRPAAAAAYLTKASYLPMSRAEREAIDGATVGAALGHRGRTGRRHPHRRPAGRPPDAAVGRGRSGPVRHRRRACPAGP